MNKSSISFAILFMLGVMNFSCSQHEKCVLSIPSFEHEIEVDGIISMSEWNSDVLVEGLIAPWETLGMDQTRFKAFYSNDYFNFCFEVVDSTIVSFDFEKELTVAKEDRVEIFFSADASLSNYYCVEIDPLGRVLDYSARHYRKFNENWDFKDIKIKTQLTSSGYIVEGRIGIAELNELGIETEFLMGVFRADFKEKHTEEVTWYSWILPQSDDPDFHICSAFGKCSF